jgi:hypothetical protein
VTIRITGDTKSKRLTKPHNRDTKTQTDIHARMSADTYLEMLLELARIGLLNVTMLVHAAMETSIWRLIHVSEQKRLAGRRPIMETRAAVSMPAHPYLEVERTVDAILLSTENGGQMLRHNTSVFLSLQTKRRNTNGDDASERNRCRDIEQRAGERPQQRKRVIIESESQTKP